MVRLRALPARLAPGAIGRGKPLRTLPAVLAVAATSVVLATAGLPDSNDAGSAKPALVERVAANLLKDDLIDRVYSYRLHRRSYDVSVLGKVSNGPERVYEVQPFPDDPEQSYRRLVAEDGRALSPEQARSHEERLRRELLEAKRKRDRESAADRARREREEAKERQRQRALLADALRVFRIDLAGSEEAEGRRLLAVTLTPRPSAHTVTSEGRHLKEFEGRALVDEQAVQLARLEMWAIDDVRLGFGIIGRIAKGSRAMYRRAPLPDGTWVPVEARFAGSGRTLMFRPFQIETWAKYSEYRRVEAGHAAARDSSHR